MTGGLGNDIYQVDNAGDLVIETSGEGIDTVQAFNVSHTLAANVENLTVMGTAGINGTGNALANVIAGNAGNNVITGGGGADTLSGGGGNDTFAWTRADLAAGTGGLDRITDFGAGDRLDFSGVFAARPAAAADVLRVADTAAGTVISADVGSGQFIDVVVLENVHGTTIDELVSAQSIVF